MMKMTPEAKVGIFTVLGIVLFAMLVLFLNHTSLFGPAQMTVDGKFQNVTGLKQGNSIRYSGVPVGKVKAISVGPQGVLLKMSIDKTEEIPIDSEFSLETDGLLGEKFIAIKPGHSSTMLKNGDVIVGDGKNNVDQALDQMGKVMVQAEKLLASINKVAGDGNSQNNLKEAIANASQITANLAQATSQINQMMAQNQASVSSIARNMDNISRNMEGVTRQLEKTMHAVDGDGKSSENMREILKNLRETTADLKNMSNQLNGVVSNEQTMEDLQHIIHNTASLTNTLSKGFDGKGNFDISGQGAFNTMYSGQKDAYDSNFAYSIRLGNTLIGTGVNHLGNNPTFDANYGKMLSSRVAMRGGIFDSALGAGIDWDVNNRMHFQAVVMNPNSVRYRYRAEMKVSPSVSAVAEFNRPYDGPHGGDYYGLQYNF